MTNETDPNIWPRTYILKLYTDAIEHGSIRISPITQDAAKSLTQSFYRFRRRVDKNTETFLQPEFQLCSVSRWADSCIYIIYSTLPGEHALPTITPVTADEVVAHLQPCIPANLPEDLVLDVAEIDPADFVRALRDEARGDEP